MAAALPRKIPAGSSPDRRRPSRAPSAASMAKLRCTASSVHSSTAIQNKPGGGLRERGCGSGRRRTRTAAAPARRTGATCMVVDPAADLDAEVLAAHEEGVTPHGTEAFREKGTPALSDHAPRHGHGPPGERPGPLLLVGGDHHGRAAARRRHGPGCREGPGARRRGRRGARRAATAPGRGRARRPAPPAAAGRPTGRRPAWRPAGPSGPAGRGRLLPPVRAGPAARTAKRTLSAALRSS